MIPRRRSGAWSIGAALGAAAIVVLAAMLLSCGSGSPLTPSRGTNSGLKIVGVTTIAPGSTAQFSALATFSDGSTKDLTTAAQWRSSDTSTLTISATGLASAVQAGEALITATLGTLAASQSILVVPAGTFKLSGRVSWLDSAINGALVQVIAGVGAGLSSSTVGGIYRLYGVASDIQLTVSEPSYVTITQTVTVSRNMVFNFDLVPLNPPPSLAGTYALRITADPKCAITGDAALLSIARQRDYSASIGQDAQSGQLTAVLSGGHFDSASNNTIYGELTAEGARFVVNDPTYYYTGHRDIAEVLPDGHVYLPSGIIILSRSGNDLVGTLIGTIRIGILPIGPTMGTVVAQCTSPLHSVTFTNQAGSPARARSRR
jgi:hypothetical protein